MRIPRAARATLSVWLGGVAASLLISGPAAAVAPAAPPGCSFDRGTTTCTSVAVASVGALRYRVVGVIGPIAYPDAPCLTEVWQETATTTTVTSHRGGPRSMAPATTTVSSVSGFVRLADVVMTCHAASVAAQASPYPPA